MVPGCKFESISNAQAIKGVDPDQRQTRFDEADSVDNPERQLGFGRGLA